MNVKGKLIVRAKPTVLEVGDRVRILEVAKECGDYESWSEEAKKMVGKGKFEIAGVSDDYRGIYYSIWTEDKEDRFYFPSYCVCLDETN